MTIAEGFLPELDAEVAATRRLIERLPIDRLDWKPHEKSRSVGELATHVTETIRWGIRLSDREFVIGTAKPPVLRTVPEFLARFDENAAGAHAVIAAKTDEELNEIFTVRRPNGDVFLQLPRRALVRRLLLSHVIHHRGQLTVYLRLCDVPLPSVYGPTADESI